VVDGKPTIQIQSLALATSWGNIFNPLGLLHHKNKHLHPMIASLIYYALSEFDMSVFGKIHVVS